MWDLPTPVRAQYLESVFRSCGEVEHKRRSPILRAVRRALEHLGQYRNREPEAELKLLVKSDLEENVDRLPRDRRSTSDRSNELDNNGIDVLLCGYSETTGSANGRVTVPPARSARADHLRATWMSAFADPSRVKLDPFCPKFKGSATR
jgi:hypothetical protein